MPTSTRWKVPSWAGVLVVLATAGVMVYAMLYRNGGLGSIFSSSPTQQATQVFSPVARAMAPQGAPGAQLVAGTRSAIVIRQGSASRHEDRGACTTCHVVVDVLGSQVPFIRALGALPHAYRGLCINCHQVAPGHPYATSGGAVGAGVPAYAPTAGQYPPVAGQYPPVAGQYPPAGNSYGPVAGQYPPAGNQYGPVTGQYPPAGNSYGPVNPYGPAYNPAYATAAPVPPAAPPAATQAPVAKPKTEGEWMGVEVVPITQLTAGQYGLPAGMQGLVIAEAEAQAATGGLRAGDVLLGINGMPVSDMMSFFRATQNGTLAAGTVEVSRRGQLLRTTISQTVAPAAPGPAAPAAYYPTAPTPGPWCPGGQTGAAVAPRGF